MDSEPAERLTRSRRLFAYITSAERDEPPRVREAMLRTLYDPIRMRTLGCLWSELLGVSALLVSGNWVFVPLILIEAGVYANHLRLSRGVGAGGSPRGSLGWMAFAMNVSVWAVNTYVLVLCAFLVDDLRIAMLAVMVAVGFSGYLSGRFHAFPRFALPMIGGFAVVGVLGFALTPVDGIGLIGLTMPACGFAFQDLWKHNHRSLMHTLRVDQENRQLSLHDPLTRLPNRLHLAERLGELRSGPAQPVAVLMLDLDRFKPVNDTHGHGAGDALLVAVADRLRAVLRPTDFVARLGGDEFVVVLPGAPLAGAITVAERLLVTLASAYALADIDGCPEVDVGTSVGIAVGDTVELDAEALIERADIALYDAKHAGRGTWRMAPLSAAPLSAAAVVS